MVSFDYRTFIYLFLYILSASFAKIQNFISYDTLSDGETEKLIHFEGTTAKETSVIVPGDTLG